MAAEESRSSAKMMSINIISFNPQSHNPIILIIIICFCLIALVAILLYIQIVCRGQNTNTTRVAVPVPVISHGLDASIIDSIPISLHGSLMARSGNNKKKEDECSICLGMFEDDERVKVLPECSHAYHSECVDKWLRNKSSCPLCRSSLDSTASTELVISAE